METTTNQAVRLDFDAASGIATLTLAMDGRANRINDDFVAGLREALAWAGKQAGLKGIILATGHRDFCVGADLDMLYRSRDAAALTAFVTGLNACFRSFETCGVPVVAALTGSAVGGGFELALACHRRIAVNDPRVQVGLPEVSLGVIPGGGGTQRLPRMLGFMAAADVILQGQTLRAPKAKDAGLVDELCPDAAAVRQAAEKWIAEHPGHKQPWDQKGFVFPPPAPGTTEARDMILAGCAMVYKKTAGAFLAPQYALSAMQEGCGLSIDRGIEVETRYFVKLAVGDQAKDMLRALWFHRNAADKHEGLPATDVDGIRKVGILGAGMMGAALAWHCANSGYEIVLKDIKPEALDLAMKHCRGLTDRRAKHLDEAGRRALLERIRATVDAKDLEGCDMIIEAVYENLDLKHRVTRELEPFLAPNGIWASNTSALPITELAKVSRNPGNFIGLHFFSPVEQMPLLEIIQGRETSQETLARALAFCRRIKKTPIVVNDGFGFFTTRVFCAYLMEAAELVAEGHDPALIEWAARSAGMVLGPLQVFDEVTLTLVRHALPNGEMFTGKSPESDGFRLLKKMVDELGRAGRAAGAGFYEYADGKRRGIWPGLKDLVTGKPAGEGVEALGRRLLLVQCREAVAALEEGVLQRKRDAEVGAIFGLGFAPNTGGPFSYLDRLGLKRAVAECEALARAHGDRYAPPRLLREMAEKGERFFEA